MLSVARRLSHLQVKVHQERSKILNRTIRFPALPSCRCRTHPTGNAVLDRRQSRNGRACIRRQTLPGWRTFSAADQIIRRFPTSGLLAKDSSRIAHDAVHKCYGDRAALAGASVTFAPTPNGTSVPTLTCCFLFRGTCTGDVQRRYRQQAVGRANYL
jgi:hypothetical protein